MASNDGFRKNLSTALLAQGVTLLVSVIISLVLPKILGVTAFGYWNLFVFYLSYSGLFWFGINDGIYLIFGGKDENSADLRRITSEFWAGILSQLVLSAALVALTFSLPIEPERVFVLILFAVAMPLINAGGFVAFVFQAFNRTNIYSRSVMIEKVTFVVFILILVVARNQDYRLYAFALLASKLVSVTYVLYLGRSFVTQRPYHLGPTLKLIASSISVGAKLTFANIASLLILGIARFIVDIQWDIETFSQVSLALSLAGFIIGFVTQVSMVLFPAMRRVSKQRQSTLFHSLETLSDSLLPLGLLAFFPISLLLSVWLPQFSASLWMFGLLLPMALFESRNQVTGSVFLKVLRRERELLTINLGCLILSGVFGYLFGFLYPSLTLLLMSIVLNVGLKSYISEYVVAKQIANARPAVVNSIALTILFEAIVLLHVPYAIGAMVFMLCSCIVLVFRRKTVISAVHMLRTT